MPRTPTPTSLALNLCRKIVFEEVLDSQPELCERVRHAIFRIVRDMLARELTRGRPDAPVRLLPPDADPALALQIARPPMRPLWEKVRDLWGNR